MRLGKWGIAALSLGVALFVLPNFARSQFIDESGQYQLAYKAAQVAGDSLAAPDGYSEDGSYIEDSGYATGDFSLEHCDDGCACSDCQGGGYGPSSWFKGNGCLLGRPGQFYFGATYIYARANFSEALAYVDRQVASDDPFIPGQDTFHMYDLDYNSSYGFDGGYRLLDCGGEIFFRYRKYQSDADFAVLHGDGHSIFTPYEVGGAIDGDVIVGSVDVDLHSYTVGVSKTIPFGSPLGCCVGGCGDTVGCGDCCGCCWCPAWDITWSAGLRWADVDWARGTARYPFNPNTGQPLDTTDSSAGTRMSFEGIGPSVGILGRRYIGRCGLFSLFARGDLALLSGTVNVDVDATRTAQVGGLGGITRASFKNIIPVTEIEVGGTAHIGTCLKLSGGYFLSAWHDLGMRDEYSFAQGQFQVQSYDDANILSFDGFFARAELAF